MELISRFKFWKVYVTIGLSSVFLFLFGYLVLSGFLTKPVQSGTGLIILGLCCIAGGLYVLFVYIRQLPRIIINAKGIRMKYLFAQRELSWSEIESIKYTGKIFLEFVPLTRAEAISLTLKDQSRINIFFEYYANGALIQQFLKNYFEKKYLPVPIIEEPIGHKDLRKEVFTTFKGTPLFSFRGIVVWLPILVLWVTAFGAGASGGAIPGLLILSIFWYVVNTLFCFYIQLSENYLVIKNHFIPFLKKAYRLSDVLEVVAESIYRWPNSIRIIKKSFNYVVFPCGTIRDEEWRMLMSQLDKKNIKTRNEIL